MPTWLKVITCSTIILLCTIFSCGLGLWLPARGTERDTGAAGAADGMMMIMYGTLGLFIGLVVGIVGAAILWSRLDKRVSTVAMSALPHDQVWPPPPTVATQPETVPAAQLRRGDEEQK